MQEKIWTVGQFSVKGYMYKLLRQNRSFDYAIVCCVDTRQKINRLSNNLNPERKENFKSAGSSGVGQGTSGTSADVPYVGLSMMSDCILMQKIL